MQSLVRAGRRRATVAEAGRFAARELLGSRGRVGAYGVDAVRVVVRHRSRDVDILDEIFVRPRVYEPPATVVEALVRAAPGGLRVLDLGGNVGLFGAYALHRFDVARIVSVEPDPENLGVLRACVRANIAHAVWDVVAACALNREGTVSFAAGNYADSAVVPEDATPSAVRMPNIDVLPLLCDADLAKIDIEGSEWPILLDPRFRAAAPPVLVLEWHAHGCPSSRDPHDAACDALWDAGYTIDSRTRTGGSSGMIWAWKP